MTLPDGKGLLLKTQLSYIIKLAEIKLVYNLKLHPHLLLHGARRYSACYWRRKVAISPSYKPCYTQQICKISWCKSGITVMQVTINYFIGLRPTP